MENEKIEQNSSEIISNLRENIENALMSILKDGYNYGFKDGYDKGFKDCQDGWFDELDETTKSTKLIEKVEKYLNNLNLDEIETSLSGNVSEETEIEINNMP